MTGEKVLEAVGVYRKWLENRGIPKRRCDFDHAPLGTVDSLAHLHNMLDQIEEFVAEERMGKAFRWLGFLQGVMWSHGFFTLNELRHHNMP
jgi:hypothetical protein